MNSNGIFKWKNGRTGDWQIAVIEVKNLCNRIPTNHNWYSFSLLLLFFFSFYLPDGKLMSPLEKSSGGAIISSISRSCIADIVLDEVTMGLLLASEGVPRDPEARLTSTRLPPKLWRLRVPITCCRRNKNTWKLLHKERSKRKYRFSAPFACAYLWSINLLLLFLDLQWLVI